jgi:hypothetical protein
MFETLARHTPIFARTTVLTLGFLRYFIAKQPQILRFSIIERKAFHNRLKQFKLRRVFLECELQLSICSVKFLVRH